jgi:hypothetical protein
VTQPSTLLATSCLALAGCSSSGGSKPQPTVTVTKTPKLSAAEQLRTCIDAWVKAHHAATDPTQTPAACDGLSADNHASAQLNGLQKRNEETQQEARKCLDVPNLHSPTDPVGRGG